MANISLLHLRQEIFQVFQLYRDLHGVRISLFTPEGIRIYPDESQPNSHYCRLIRREMGKEAVCRRLDYDMVRQCIGEDRLISYRCHAGLQEAAMPLKIGGQVVGCVMLGQFRLAEHEERSPYSDMWNRLQGDTRLDQAFDQSVRIGGEKTTLLLELYQLIMNIISRTNLIGHKDYDLIRPVVEALQHRPDWQPSMQDAVELMGRSPSSVSRLFRRITGMSFKEYVIEQKMNAAEQRFRENPNAPVAQIAAAQGYSDPLYFSRLFKKQRGISPKMFAMSMRT